MLNVLMRSLIPYQIALVIIPQRSTLLEHEGGSAIWHELMIWAQR